MGRSRNNFATEGLSGRVGNFVFRRRRVDGKIFVGKRPTEFEGLSSAAQLDIRRKFSLAIAYAKAAIIVPAIKQAYKEAAPNGCSAYNMAIADYFNAPVIESLDTSAYTGAVGSTISIVATDDFEVKNVHVKLAEANGTLIEEGEALIVNGAIEWTYAATVNNPNLVGTKVTVTVTDNPNNKTIQMKVL